MPIETASTINQLDALLPDDNDPIAQSAAHARLIKSVLKTTFANVTAAVTATHTQINSLGDLLTRVTAVEGNRARTDVATTMAGPVTVTAALNAGTIQQGGAALIPSGTVVMWFGAHTSIPTGWRLCDGTFGTPDLRDRFVTGSGGGLATGAVVGANTMTATSASAGSHTHGGTSAGGAHGHGGITYETTLDASQMPAHTHTGTTNADGAHAHSVPLFEMARGSGGTGGVYGEFGSARSVTTSSDGSHTHSFTTAVAGSGLGHAHAIPTEPGHVHAIPSDGAHTHAVTFDNRPASVALCFIMKT